MGTRLGLSPRAASTGPGASGSHEAIGDDALGPGLEWVSATISSKSLLTELKDAVRRISELVAAVRSYSQLDRASRQRVDVREGLDSTLTMLGHKLRGGVTVLREYDELPPIDAFAGELNQVWTNLVDNAVDAMDGQGTLTVRTRAEGDWIVVEIADTGSGMAPEVAARAFEPFFTTKDVGRGTGLGLDIARRIVVERHGGLIDIDSPAHEGKGTVMRVSLPLRPATDSPSARRSGARRDRRERSRRVGAPLEQPAPARPRVRRRAGRPDEVVEDLHEQVGMVLVGEVTRLGQDLDPRLRRQLGCTLRMAGRDDAVLVAPDHAHRHRLGEVGPVGHGHDLALPVHHRADDVADRGAGGRVAERLVDRRPPRRSRGTP